MRGHSNTSQLDEGYSEETRSQSDGSEMLVVEEDTSPAARVKGCVNLLMGLPTGERKQIMMEVIKSLDNDDKAEVKNYIELLTHFDPADYFPAEVFLSIFAYLPSKDLLSASVVSRAWRQRALDEGLWKRCFASEGWLLDHERVEKFEEGAEKQRRKGMGSKEGGVDLVPGLERKESRKRSSAEAFNERADAGMGMDGAMDVRAVSEESQGEDMEGVEVTAAVEDGSAGPSHRPAATPAKITPESSTDEEDTTSALSSLLNEHIDFPPLPSDIKVEPTMFQTTNAAAKLSWSYLYKQRRRLERNWEKGDHVSFQIPHPDHADEGHTECVYTIQHTSKHLVSGSRDKTIRIWDMQTYRLKRKPLEGHTASVLCLQFDERPEQDIIVSGGSDSSVIVWKFSTGEIVQHLPNAHKESVLNLRFDDRYIVTCSKDKTIKIWNRHAIARDSPLIPTRVLADFTDPTTACRGGSELQILPFTHLASIEGHHAAVNAVMIHDNIVVSASGDRTVKAWNIITGEQKKNYAGHSKGIACVQFDGRRVVSGSSDNTVRIFDAETQAEVACLQGHQNLVRTVQARFGDLWTTTAEELAAQARAADHGFLRAMAQGRPASSPARLRGIRNAGSSRPEDMTSIGTRIPPGGGGTKWAKIVSGSYDETVIIWRRDPEGKWKPMVHLHQDQIFRDQRTRRRVPAAVRVATAANANANNAPVPAPTQAQAVPPAPAAQGAGAGAGGGTTATQNQAAQIQQMLIDHASTIADMLEAVQDQANGAGNPQGNGAAANAQAQALQQLAQVNALIHQQQLPQQQQQNQNQNTTTTNTSTQQTTTTSTAQAAPPQQPNNNNTAAHAANATNSITAAIQQATAAQQAAAAAGGAGREPHARESYRIFKLQFDARRIICCSQNKIIVGWDFAKGDRELERVGDWSLETA